MKPAEIIAYAEQVAQAWRDEEYEHLTVGNTDAAYKCHLGAIVLEQFVHDVQAFQACEVKPKLVSKPQAWFRRAVAQ